MLHNTLSFNFCSIICSLVSYRRLKTKEKFQFLAPKVVIVAYRRWLLLRSFKYSDLTLKILAFFNESNYEINIGTLIHVKFT